MRASARAFLFGKTEAEKSRRRESERARPSFLSGHCPDFSFSGRKGRGIVGKCVPLAATAMACSGVPFSAPVLVGGPWREEGMRASAWAFLFDKTEAKKSRRRESERANPSFLSGYCPDFSFSGRKGRGIVGKCVPLAATAMACSGVPFSAPAPFLSAALGGRKRCALPPGLFFSTKRKQGKADEGKANGRTRLFYQGIILIFLFPGEKGGGSLENASRWRQRPWRAAASPSRPRPRSCRRPLAGGRDARFRPGFPFRQNGSGGKPAKGKRTVEPVFFVRALF